MKIPFTTEEFLEVFRRYNEQFFPWQFVIFYALAAILVDQVFRTRRTSGVLIGSVLGLFWFWMGWVYHIHFFSAINPIAKVFGALFLIQGVLLLLLGKKLVYDIPRGPRFPAILVILFALMVYPLIGHGLGHTYPSSPTFGLPCPTTIFTFGLLMASLNRVPSYLLIIPSLWAIVGFSAVLNFGFMEDIALLLTAAAAWYVNIKKPAVFTPAEETNPRMSTTGQSSEPKSSQPAR